MAFLGFEEIQQNWKKGGKMVYLLYQKPRMDQATEKRQVPTHLTKKVVIRQGNRNNFAILL